MAGKMPQFAEDVVRFESVAAMRVYIKALYDHYMAEVDQYGAKAGDLMRERVKQEANLASRTLADRRDTTWQKMGTLLLNNGDTGLAFNEVDLQLLSDYRAKAKATAEALKSFEAIRQFKILPGTSFVLYLYEGVPSRIILEKPLV